MQNYQRVCRVVDTGGSVPAATSWPPFITQEPLVAMSMGDCSSPPQTMYLGPSPGQEPHLFWEKIHPPTLNPENCWTVSMSQTVEGDGFGSVPAPALRTSHSIPLASGRSNHWVTGANQRETPPLLGEMELS